jgi:hypothetical protein
MCEFASKHRTSRSERRNYKGLAQKRRALVTRGRRPERTRQSTARDSALILRSIFSRGSATSMTD